MSLPNTAPATPRALDLQIRTRLAGQPDWLAEMLVGGEDPRNGHLCADLMAPGGLDAVLRLFGENHEGAARPAVSSLWSQHYFALLCLPLIAAALPHDEPVAGAPEQIEMICDEIGRPVALRLCAGSPQATSWDETPLDPLLQGHLLPMVAAIARAGGISARVLWGNAAHYIEWLIGALKEQGRLSETGQRGAELFLHRLSLPDGQPNPLRDAIHYQGLPPAPECRSRKTCCLRYLLPNVPTCGTLCPRPEIRARALG
ncbi:siderophore-iron reductase FhuF [Paracoccus aminophilus]|uniref:Iron reductase protein FhuF n=1 Tax=Paracoccus aminophilus JCM 7686 TaxID=1367847 RepID=S5XXU2_PARAH|nr:siderophore-iron reductase FhuF [Paracoccus aminophilus]AGT08270.1 iron reductase protein FhuF [Paracoccus aminophilus JCM 7686]